MKHVLIITPGRGIGGIEKRFATLYEYLAKKETSNIKTTFIVSRSHYSEILKYQTTSVNKNLKIIKYGIPFIKKYNKIIPLLYIDLLLFWGLIFFKFREKYFDAIHFTKVSVLIARNLMKAKVKVYSFVDSTFRILYEKQTARILKKIFFEGFKIDCLSEDIMNEGIKFSSDNRDNFHLAPCSFINYDYTSIGEKEKFIVFLARFVEMKGVELLVKSIAKIVERLPNIEIKILGYGELEDDIKNEIKDKNLSDNIEIYFERKPINVLKRSLIFLSIQKYENYPSQSLIEAMACGNAIIATDVGLTHKIVNGDVGILIEPEPDSLVDAIEKLLSNSEVTKEMGRRAREKVMQEHTIERFANYLFGLYEVNSSLSFPSEK